MLLCLSLVPVPLSSLPGSILLMTTEPMGFSHLGPRQGKGMTAGDQCELGLERMFSEVATLHETEPGLCKVKRGRLQAQGLKVPSSFMRGGQWATLSASSLLSGQVPPPKQPSFAKQPGPFSCFSRCLWLLWKLLRKNLACQQSRLLCLRLSQSTFPCQLRATHSQRAQGRDGGGSCQARNTTQLADGTLANPNHLSRTTLLPGPI